MGFRIKRRTLIDLPDSIEGPRQVRVGFPSGKSSDDVMMRAIWTHYGTRGGASGGGWGGPVPARPFLMNAVRNNRRKYIAALRTSAARIMRGDLALGLVMDKLGILAQGDVQQEITDLREPPNAPATIRLKGSSNPLIDSGEMRRAVTWEVST